MDEWIVCPICKKGRLVDMTLFFESLPIGDDTNPYTLPCFSCASEEAYEQHCLDVEASLE